MTLKHYLALGAVLVALVAGWFVKSVIDERAALRLEVSSKNETIRLMGRAEKTTSSVLSQRVVSAKAIQQKASDVQQQIQATRPGAECELPESWRVLHDAAAASPVPPAP